MDHGTRTLLEVPEKQMDAFIRVLTEYPDTPVGTDFPIVKGTRVRVVRGPLKGIANTTLYCGPGTAGKVINGNQPSAGVMGDAVISGPTILRILMNSNEHRIASGTVSSYVRNSNYMTNYYYGRGGGAVLSYNYDGGVPFCFIEKIEREQYGV